MSNVIAIARYEILMAWRRRSLPILWLVLVLTCLAFSLLSASQTQSIRAASCTSTRRRARLLPPAAGRWKRSP